MGRFGQTTRKSCGALRDLRLPLATTNYDGLLEEATGLPAATWKDTPVIEDLLRGKPPRAILDLHVYWGASRLGDPRSRRLPACRASGSGAAQALATEPHSALRRLRRRPGRPQLVQLAALVSRVPGRLPLPTLPALPHGGAPDLERQHPAAERLFPIASGAEFGDLAVLRRLQPPPTRRPPLGGLSPRAFRREGMRPGQLRSAGHLRSASDRLFACLAGETPCALGR